MIGEHHQNDLRALVSALRAIPSVADCAVVPSAGANGPMVLAYVVPRGAFSEASIRRQLGVALPPDGVAPDAIVPVDTLPFTAAGQIDHAALTALPVLDEALVAQWEHSIRNLPGVRQAAVLLQPFTPEQRRLLWADLPGVPPTQSLPMQSPPPMHLADTRQPQLTDDRPALSEGGPLPRGADAPATLSDLLLRAAQRAPQHGCIHRLPGGEQVERSYAELLDEARRVLAGLRAHGIGPGDHVIVQINRGPGFLAAVWGCFLGGIVPAPITVAPSYAAPNSVLAKLRAAWELLDHPTVVTETALADGVRGLEHVAGMPGLDVLTVEALAAHKPAADSHAVAPDDVALMLFTSGSTGNAKAVEQRHRNLLAMSAGTIAMNGFTTDDVTLNWMPLDHVGSLVFLGIVPMELGCTQIHAANSWVLEDPVRWLSLIETHRATISWAPNFAFALLEKRRQAIRDQVRDLPSMRFLVNAGEANIAATMRRFIDLLADHGLQEHALRPAFGMSETCSGITWSAGFSPASDDGAPVALGRPIPGAALRIVDEAGTLLNEGQVGQLQVRGPSVFQGYYRNPEANRAAFEDDWFTTGDLGTLQDGELIVTGRQKEDLVVNGVHHACHDIEALIEQLDEVTTSFTAAVPVRHPRTGAEEFAIFYHTAVTEPRARAAVERRIRGAVAAQTGASPQYLVAVAPDDVPKTAIGKIQRPLLKKRFEAGDFDDRLGVAAEAQAGSLPDWFLRPAWRPRAIETPDDAGQRPLLVLDGATGPGAALEAAVCDRWPGPVRILRPDADPVRQFEALAREGFVPAEVLHLGMFDLATTASGGGDFAAGAWFDGHVAALAGLIAVARAWRRVWGSQAGAAAALRVALRVATCGPAGLRGFLTTVGLEHSGLHCQHIDLSAADETATWADQVVRELLAATPEHAVRWRGAERLVVRLERVPWEDRRVAPAEQFHHGGHYLVTGGLGGIGRVLCRHLLERYSARLLVLGTTPLPPQGTPTGSPGEAAEGGSAEDQAENRAAALRALERCAGGGAIRYQPVDVCDRERLAACVAGAEAEWGALDGVVNLAGVAAERALADETPATVAAALRAKMLGTLTLDALLGRRPGILFLHFSSVSGSFGGVGVGAYAAACGFVEDFAEQRRHAGATRSACFAWTHWQDIGMSAGRELDTGAAAARGFLSLSAEQGLLSLEAGLRRGEDALVIGLDDSSPGLRGWLHRAPTALLQASAYLDAPADTVPDADLRGLALRDLLGRPADYRIVRVAALPLLSSGDIDRRQLAEHRDAADAVAPRTPTERAIAEIWSELLGTTTFGVFDNFFELGGQSLLATSLVSRLRDRLSVELGVDTAFSAPTIAALAEACDGAAGPADTPPLQHASRDQPLPLSFAQERLWILERMTDGDAPYNEMVAMSLLGDVDAAALSRGLTALLRRHEILRTRFPLRGATAVQEIATEADLTLRQIDFSGVADGDRRRALDAAVTELRAEPFDLARGPLLRVALFLLGPRSAVLVLVLHHIVADAWSLGLLMREWSALYRGAELPPPPLQYADFAVWQRAWLDGAVLERQLGYWRQALRGAPALLELPTDRPRPALPRHRGGRVPLTLEPGLVESLRDLGGSDGATLFMTLTAVFATLLHRHTAQTDILLGLPVANRRRSEAEAIMGLFVNTLALRVDLSGSPSFRDLLGRVRQAALGAYAHQDLPFERLVDDLQLDRNVGTNPLVQVMIELQEQPLALIELPDADVQSAELGEPTVRVDLELHLFEHRGGVQGYFLYDTSLFTAARISRLASQLRTLAAAAVRDPGCRIGALDLLPAAERQLVTEAFAFTETFASTSPSAPTPLQTSAPPVSSAPPFAPASPSPRPAAGDPSVHTPSMHSLVETQAARTPTAEAVCDAGGSVTYRELTARSDRLAARLRSLGVGPEVVVAQYLPRSIVQVVGLLAILKAGGVYLPLEVSDPLERTARLLDDSGAPVVLTMQALEGGLPSHGGQVLCLDDPEAAGAEAEATAAPEAAAAAAPEAAVAPGAGAVRPNATPAPTPVPPDAAAYLIYTSGSTGAPKGAVLAHRGFVTMIAAQIRAFAITPADRVLQFASLGFDASLSEIFMALGAGACLVVPPDAARTDPTALRHFLREEHISVATLPPALLRQMGTAGPGPLRLLVTAGEAAPVAEVTAAARGMTVWNAYGPTEASVCATMQPVEAGADYAGPDYAAGVPIGRPIEGVELLILRGDEPVPIGVDGEICLGGAVLARGYLGQPGLTAQQFVPHPWRAGRRLYRTGDIGRWRADGAVDYVGRLNHEVKVRGHRVAPGEVERAMLEHPRVGQACVTGYREADGVSGLCGYYAAGSGGAGSGGLGSGAAGSGLELWPSLAEFFVYDALLYGAMAGHRERNDRYRAAFAKVLAGRTVVEIGPGPEAILARLCLEAGARRVYCIELLRETAGQAQRTVRALGLADRIVVLHGDVRTVTLPEPVDYCVSEIVGSIGGAEGAALLINAARRLLRDGRNMIPARAETRLAAVSVSEGLELAFPETAAHYVEQVFAQKGYRFDLRLCLKHAARRHLLSTEAVLEDLDFTREVAPEAAHAVALRFTRSGVLHGLLAWLVLHTDAAEALDTLDSQDSWLPVFLPVSLAGLAVSAGDVFRGRVERRLSSNGLNPDYRVHGVLERRDAPAVPIDCVSRHDAAVFRGSEFYRALFAGEAVPVARPPEPAELRAYLAQRLPRYMVPGRLVRLPRLAVTASGKVDRAALGAAGAGAARDATGVGGASSSAVAAAAFGTDSGVAFGMASGAGASGTVASGTDSGVAASGAVASGADSGMVASGAASLGALAASGSPRDAVEAAVAAIWREVLEVEHVGIRENFFDAGGHSLRLVQVHQKLEARFGGCVTPVELFQFPTIEAIAELIGRRAGSAVAAAAEPADPRWDAAAVAAESTDPAQDGPETAGLGRDAGATAVQRQDAGVRDALRQQASIRRAHRTPVGIGSGVG